MNRRENGPDPELIARAAQLVEDLGDRAAGEDDAFAAGFRAGYGHGYAIGHAHGIDHAEDHAAGLWAKSSEHLRKVREAERTNARAADRRADAAVAAAEREARAMADRHYDTVTHRTRDRGTTPAQHSKARGEREQTRRDAGRDSGAADRPDAAGPGGARPSTVATSIADTRRSLARADRDRAVQAATTAVRGPGHATRPPEPRAPAAADAAASGRASGRDQGTAW